jgi:hypothetical protein
MAVYRVLGRDLVRRISGSADLQIESQDSFMLEWRPPYGWVYQTAHGSVYAGGDGGVLC